MKKTLTQGSIGILACASLSLLTASASALERKDLMPLIKEASTNNEPAYVEVLPPRLGTRPPGVPTGSPTESPRPPEPARAVIKIRESAYMKIRDKIVGHGAEALPLLAEIAVDESLPWQQRLVARICDERIARKGDIEKLLGTDWYAHPDFEPRWNQLITGPIGPMTQLVSADVQKAGLWYYCLEQVWKSTGEVGEIFIERHQEGWVGACVIAVKDTPEERVWFLRVCSDLMAMSPPPPRWSSWLYPMLLREKKPDTVPLLLDAMLFNKEDIFEFIYTMSEYADSRSADALERLATKYPPPDDRTRLLVEAIKQHENDPTLTVETFNARRIAELLAPVRARRAPPPEPEPPFRLGTKIIKPAKQP